MSNFNISPICVKKKKTKRKKKEKRKTSEFFAFEFFQSSVYILGEKIIGTVLSSIQRYRIVEKVEVVFIMKGCMD